MIMRSGAFWVRALSAALALAAVGCQQDSDSPSEGDGTRMLFIVPAALSVEEGATLQLHAFLVANGSSVGVDATFSSENVDVATVSEAGVLEGMASGTSVITAAYDGLETTATATVTPGVVGIQVFPANGDVAVDLARSYRLVALRSDHTSQDVTASASWSVRDPAIATASGGVVTGVAAGTTRVTASYRGRDASTNVTVSNRVVTSLAISGGPTALEQLTTGELKATATFDDATTLDVTGSAAWTSTNPAVVAVSGGILEPRKEGAAGVTASFAQGDRPAVTATQAVTVKAETVVVDTLTVSPAAVTIPLETGTAFTATATFSDGSERDVTSLVDWSLENATGDEDHHAVISGNIVSTVSVPGRTIVVGETKVVATFTLADGKTKKTSKATLTVSEDALASVALEATSLSIPVGGTTAFTATADYGDPVRFTYDLAGEVTWFAVDGTALNDVVLAIDPVSGFAVGLAPGTATVEAWLDGVKKGQLTVTVQ